MSSYLAVAHEYNQAAAAATAPETAPPAPVAAPKKPAPSSARVRARTAAGAFVADDPSTPENEAWEDGQP